MTPEAQSVLLMNLRIPRNSILGTYIFQLIIGQGSVHSDLKNMINDILMVM